MPLLCQCNGHKIGRLSQTTLTIPQSLFQCTLNLVKTICFSGHIINNNSRGLFSSWMCAQEITLSMNPGCVMSKKTLLWPLRLFVSYNPICIKTSFTLFFPPPSTVVCRSSLFPFATRLAPAAKTL